MPFLSASEYTSRARINVCGSTGAVGPTGPQGPQGPQGPSGISSGAIYYFELSGGGAVLTGPNNPSVVGKMSKTPGSLSATNTYYNISPNYEGYFNQLVGPQTSPVLIAGFKTLSGDPNITSIPAGIWTFYVNAYSFTQKTPDPTVPPTVEVASRIFVKLYKSPDNGVTKNLIEQSGYSDVPGISDSTPIIIALPVPLTSMTVNDTLYVEFYMDSVASGNAIEFWTEGDSISHVITTLAPSSGPTGATGPSGPIGYTGYTGYTGDTGPLGPIGPVGPQGAQGPQGPQGPQGNAGSNGTSFIFTVQML